MTEETVETPPAEAPKPKAARAPKAAKPPDDGPLLAALLKALDGEPMPLVPAKGYEASLFPAAAAGKALLTRAMDAGYVEECDGPPLPPPPPGAKKAKAPAKLPQHGRITEKGREWVLEHTSPRQAMEGLLAAFERQSGALHGGEADVSTLQAQLGELQHGLTQTQAKFDAQVAELASHLQTVQRGIDAVVERRKADAQRVIETIQAVSAHLTRGVEAEKSKAAPRADLTSEVVAFVDAFRRDKGADCPLPELYAHLKGKQPSLTIGTFHDLVRKLHHAHQIRLTGWADTLDSLPEPESALFVSNKVMYYAHVPEGTA